MDPRLNELLQFIIDDDNFWDDVLIALLNSGLTSMGESNVVSRVPCRTRPFSGHQFITDILSGHPERGYNHFRMTNTMFVQLEELLVSRGLLRGSRYVTAKEQLGFFLYGIGHCVTNRVLAETFQHSGETISRYFNTVLKAICNLKHDYIVQPDDDVGVHPRIRDSNLFHPFFKVRFHKYEFH